MKKRVLSVIMTCCLMTGLLVGCATTGTQSTSESDGESVVELNIPLDSEPSSLDCGYGNSSDSISVRGMMFEGLVRIYDNEIAPAMAESWEISEDGKTYTFYLQESYWSDGVQVTAYDFEYAFKRLLDPEGPNGNYSWMGYYIENGEAYHNGECTADEVGVVAISDTVLEVTSEGYYPYFLDILKNTCFYPVREDIVELYGDDYASSPDTVVCNGPFVLTEWNHDSSLTFEINTEYWNVDAINVDQINASIISDTDTAMSMFENGQLDMTNTIPKEQIDTYIESGEAVEIVGATIWSCAINTSTDRGDISALLQNQNFRNAFSYALDRDGLVEAARGDGSFSITRMVPEVMSVLDSTWGESYPIETSSQDLDLAQELFALALEETGLSADDLPSLVILTFDDDAATTSATIIQNLLKTEFGIEATIDVQSYSARQDKENAGDYDFCITNWAPDYNDPMTFLECYTSTSSYNLYFGGMNNEEYDELIALANDENTSLEDRAEYMAEAELIAIEEMVNVPLFQTSGYWAMQTNISGISKCGFGANDPDFSLVNKE